MAYRVYGRVISNGLSGNLRLNQRYKIDIHEDMGVFTVPTFKDTIGSFNSSKYKKQPKVANNYRGIRWRKIISCPLPHLW